MTDEGCCKFNAFVDCEDDSRCEKCCWNPKVQEERIKKIKMKEEQNNE